MVGCAYFPTSCRKKSPRSKLPATCTKSDGTRGRHVRAHSRPKGCADRASVTLQKHARARTARNSYHRARARAVRLQSLLRKVQTERKESLEKRSAAKRKQSAMEDEHPYFVVAPGAEPFVHDAVRLASNKMPIPSLVRSQFEKTLATPARRSSAVPSGDDPFAFPHGTSAEKKHLLPVLFWAAYLEAPSVAKKGVDYLDFKHRTFQQFFEADNLEKQEGEHVLTLCNRIIRSLMQKLRLKKPNDAWMKKPSMSFVVQYETKERKDVLSAMPLTYHNTDSTIEFIGVFLYTVSLAMAASNA